MSLRSKILVVMALPVLVLSITALALLNNREQTTAALVAERNAAAVHSTLERILADLTSAETASRGFELTGQAPYLDPYTQATEALRNDFRTLAGLTGDETITTAEVADLRALVDHRISLLTTTPAPPPALDPAHIERTMRAFARARDRLIQETSIGQVAMDHIGDLVSRHEERIAGLLAQTERSLDSSRNLTSLVGVAGLALGLLASLLVVMLFIQRLVARIVRTGDLARMLDEGLPMGEASTSDDELGQLERILVRSGNRVVELQGELRRMGTTDVLTRFMNRRGFMPSAEQRLGVSMRTNQPMALMFLDLDGLKRVNDTFGHAAGDGMIAEGAYVIRETFRSSDLIARMGGDEFCVLFAAASHDVAKVALTRLKAAEAVANGQQGRQFTLSFSAGVAMFDPDDPCTLDQLIAIADERMYARKRAKPAPAEIVAAMPLAL